ncbi:hypothetical protein [Streptomyces sp. MS2.AVA.5]|uniref:Uncharacterized protein n=1 Tax=Streptomyces achmelvichensis TaxID=3134111 RepID=A0ACC6Q8V8_9ACTN
MRYASTAAAVAVLSMFSMTQAISATTTDTTVEVEATDGLNISSPANWTATAALSSSFATGGGTPAETISGADVDYAPGAAINPVNGPFVPGSPGDLGALRPAFSRPSGSGDNSVSWNPTLTVHVPAEAVAGEYTGVVRHSVA